MPSRSLQRSPSNRAGSIEVGGRRGNHTSLVEVLCVDWWMYLLMAAAAIVLLNVLLVVALVAFRRDGELSD